MEVREGPVMRIFRVKNIPGRKDSECKGPEAGRCLVYNPRTMKRLIWLKQNESRECRRGEVRESGGAEDTSGGVL